MSVSVLVPYRSECPGRKRVWRWLEARWRAAFPTWEIVEAGDDGGAWAKGAAVARAVERSAGEVLVVVDADVWCPAIAAAVGVVEEGATWSVPHRQVARLTERATARVLAGDLDVELAPEESRNVHPPRYSGMIGGGAVVIRRDAYLEAPLDPRFRGWGCEDHAWGIALLTLHGKPIRPDTGNLIHLWHPPARERSRNQVDPASEALRIQYAAARGRASVMRELIRGRNTTTG